MHPLKSGNSIAPDTSTDDHVPVQNSQDKDLAQLDDSVNYASGDVMFTVSLWVHDTW